MTTRSTDIAGEVIHRQLRVDKLRAELAVEEKILHDLRLQSLGVGASSDPEHMWDHLSHLHAQGMTLKQIAKKLDSTVGVVAYQAYKLARKGRYPLPLKNPEDTETELRNNILRVWQWRSVQDISHVAQILELPLDTVEPHFRWLVDNKYITNWINPARGAPAPAAGPSVTVVSKSAPPSVLPTSSAAPILPTSEAAVPDPVPSAPRDHATEHPAPRSPLPESPVIVSSTDPMEKAASCAELTAEIKRQQGGQKQKLAELTTSLARKHRHVAKVDFFGEGHTVADASGHVHRVKEFCIMAAHNHFHEFTIAAKE